MKSRRSGRNGLAGWVEAPTDARAPAIHAEVARAAQVGLMVILTILAPALLFAFGTVAFALREERALGVHPIRRR